MPKSAVKRGREAGRGNVRGEGKGGPESKAQAMMLLAERWSVAEVARRIGVNSSTVRSWRASPDGYRMLEAAREAHRAAFNDALEKARRTLIESLPEAAEVLREALQHGKIDPRLRAACSVFDRTGLHPRAEFEPPPDVDTSNLTEEELRQYLALCRKMQRNRQG